MKIIGIGLPKTGTTSLHHALRRLGYDSIHTPTDRRTAEQIRRGDYRLEVLERHDAISDIPIPAIFPQLDVAFPGSRFILTMRDEDSWIQSQKGAWFNARPPAPSTTRALYRGMLYGVIDFNEERFRWVYRDHLRRVSEHFSGERDDDLLTLDLAKGDGWERLCAFLGVPEPDEPFPRSNTKEREIRPRKRSLAGQIPAAIRRIARH